MSVMF